MTWKSMILNGPGPDELEYSDPTSTAYEDWLDKVMAEPWVRAMEDMVKWTGLWCGSEERLIKELRMRAGKEAGASPDFPSSLGQLEWYVGIALDGFIEKRIGLLDWRKQTQEELEVLFDVPDWGPEAPALIHRFGAADRPDYWDAMYRMRSYGDALPLAVLIFTGDGKEFKNSRTWTGTTTQLIEKLREHSPKLGRVPFFIANRFRPPEEHRLYHIVDFDPPDLLYPFTREDYVIFHRRMRGWARTLKEERIGVSWEKRATLPGTRIKIDGPPRTFWTIRAPNWKRPDLLGIDQLSRRRSR